MTYELTQEQQILRETIRDFASSEIAPLASKIDWECRVPDDLLSKLPQMGLYGITVPSELGGAGADFLSLIIAIEEVSKASGSLGAQLSFQNAVVCEALVASTNSKIKEDLVPKLASGSLGAFDFSSATTGSATASPNQGPRKRQILCRIEGSDLVVNGSSEYVISASSADVFLVLGALQQVRGEKTNPKPEHVIFAFSKESVPQNEFSVGEPKKLLGMRAAGTARISFNNLRISLQSLLYEVEKTKEALDALLARVRLAVASQALGIGQASIDASVKYANERSQFNTKIGNFYAVQDMIASDSVELETSRALAYLTARDIKTGSPTLNRDGAISKVACSNASVQASRHAIRVHGGYGFTRDYPVERYARDARFTQIYMESNEDLKAIIARSLLG